MFCHSVPNEGAGKDGAIRTARLVGMGMRAGVADLVVWWPALSGGTDVGYVEVKTADGRQSERQRAFQAKCAEHGVPYMVARSVADVKNELERRLRGQAMMGDGK